jgi:hypothetical protein
MSLPLLLEAPMIPDATTGPTGVPPLAGTTFSTVICSFSYQLSLISTHVPSHAASRSGIPAWSKDKGSLGSDPS